MLRVKYGSRTPAFWKLPRSLQALYARRKIDHVYCGKNVITVSIDGRKEKWEMGSKQTGYRINVNGVWLKPRQYGH